MQLHVCEGGVGSSGLLKTYIPPHGVVIIDCAVTCVTSLSSLPNSTVTISLM